jgi:hypothetical protein
MFSTPNAALAAAAIMDRVEVQTKMNIYGECH